MSVSMFLGIGSIRCRDGRLGRGCSVEHSSQQWALGRLEVPVARTNALNHGMVSKSTTRTTARSVRVNALTTPERVNRWPAP